MISEDGISLRLSTFHAPVRGNMHADVVVLRGLVSKLRRISISSVSASSQCTAVISISTALPEDIYQDITLMALLAFRRLVTNRHQIAAPTGVQSIMRSYIPRYQMNSSIKYGAQLQVIDIQTWTCPVNRREREI